MKFYEFFAGGGMVREGLGARWSCLFANDWDDKLMQRQAQVLMGVPKSLVPAKDSKK